MSPSHADLIQLVTRDPRDVSIPELYDASKQIDGHPETLGTTILAHLRVATFYEQRRRQTFYEPVSTYEQLFDVSRLTAALYDANISPWWAPWTMILFEIFESAYTAPRGRLSLPRPGEASKGGHAVAVRGWEDSGDTIGFVNSWGERWGDHGYGSMPRAYFERYMQETWVARNIRVGPSAFTYPRLEAAATPKDFAKAWMLPNPRWRARISHHGQSHKIVVYETLSLVHEGEVQIIELRTGFGILVGWAYLYHLRAAQPRTSILHELFVWPDFRRRGYGSLLESVATANARRWRSERIQIAFHSIDAVPPARAAGRLFGQQAGYRWAWRPQRCPNLAAMGEKAL